MLMALTTGRPETRVALIDGPVAIDHPNLVAEHIREIPGRLRGACGQADSVACTHGTFVAGILNARRDSAAPGICPDCTLLLCPIFAETIARNLEMPSATPKELAAALVDSIEAGARVINLSAALTRRSSQGARELEASLGYAARREVIVVAAAGNQGAIGSTTITSHPWVIPVAACDLRGRPLNYSNASSSIGRRGLSAPGDHISSIGSSDEEPGLGGTSAAAPFVAGTAALLCSEFPGASGAQIRTAITQPHGVRPGAIVPPLLDAWAAYRALATTQVMGRAT
jgi:subtilisin family serine protease